MDKDLYLKIKKEIKNKRIKEILDKLDYYRFDYCYIESMTGPISGHLDRKLIKKCMRKILKLYIFLEMITIG